MTARAGYEDADASWKLAVQDDNGWMLGLEPLVEPVEGLRLHLDIELVIARVE